MWAVPEGCWDRAGLPAAPPSPGSEWKSLLSTCMALRHRGPSLIRARQIEQEQHGLPPELPMGQGLRESVSCTPSIVTHNICLLLEPFPSHHPIHPCTLIPALGGALPLEPCLCPASLIPAWHSGASPRTIIPELCRGGTRGSVSSQVKGRTVTALLGGRRSSRSSHLLAGHGGQ